MNAGTPPVPSEPSGDPGAWANPSAPEQPSPGMDKGSVLLWGLGQQDPGAAGTAGPPGQAQLHYQSPAFTKINRKKEIMILAGISSGFTLMTINSLTTFTTQLWSKS